MGVYVKVSPSGRISLPAAMRKRLGLDKGGNVLIEETEEGLMILTTAQAIARVQKWTRELIGDRPGFSVDDFIADKRREAAREDE